MINGDSAKIRHSFCYNIFTHNVHFHRKLFPLTLCIIVFLFAAVAVAGGAGAAAAFVCGSADIVWFSCLVGRACAT